jgi:hypothetical protein
MRIGSGGLICMTDSLTILDKERYAIPAAFI